MADQLVVAALRVVFLALHHPGAAALHPGAGVRAAQPPPAPGPAGRGGPDPVGGRPSTWSSPASTRTRRCWRPAAARWPARTTRGRMRVWLVDDGSRNQPPCWPSTSGGPSGAGTCGCWTATSASAPPRTRPSGGPAGELLVLMDSDTVLAPDAIRQAAAAFRDDQVGAVSGSIGVLNAPTNLLTRLIHHRYRLRFQVERPAQGFFTSLLCCSGPFAVYRRSLLDELWPRYLTQTFARRPLHQRRRPAPDQPGPGHRPPGAVRAPGDRQHQACPGRCGRTCASSCAGTAASTGSCAGPSPASGPGIPTWPLTCWPGRCCPCCWPPPWCCWRPRGCWSAGSCWPPTSAWPWPCCCVTAAFLLVHGASVPFLLLYGPLHMVLLVPVRV